MVTQQEYRTRRQNLAQKLSPNAIAIIPAASEVLRNGDAHYRFRQDSHFYYLTGFNEPDALLCITGGNSPQSYLFNQPRNPAQEQWTGIRLGQDNALHQLGIDKAYSIDDVKVHLPNLLANKSSVYYLMGRYPTYEALIMDTVQYIKTHLRRGIEAPQTFIDLDPILGEMRLIKSDAELKLMRRAAEISVNAHKATIQACKQANYEYELEAMLLYEFTRQGCRDVAYTTIVGGGANSCILHYTANNQRLRKGDLVLIDAGGEFENYAADITRTFPVTGQFKPSQRAIYNLVLKAQRAGIAVIKPGVAWNKIQEVMVYILTEGLCELGILKGNVNQLVEAGAYKPFYMHNSGHWLGLDVHDCGRYKINGAWRPLEVGMVLTVEPGLYISAEMEGVDEQWWNIGVRIEDDIVVTTDGWENLTANLPVEISDIEALMRD